MAYLLKDISNNIAFNTGSLTANLGTNIVASSIVSGLNVGGTYLSNGVSALKIPADSSNNRPAGQTGYIRYNTDTNVIEYWNGNTSSWEPISPPTPVFGSISPQYILQDVSSTVYTISGGNFNSTSNVSFIGNVDSITYPSAVTTFNSSVQLTCLITDAIADASNNTAFAVKVTNTNTGFSATSGSVVLYNKGPIWNTTPGSSLGTGLTQITYTTGTSPFTDLSASDVPPANLPINYYSSITPLNSSAPLVTLDATLGRLIGTMPTVSTSTLYNFSAYPQDASGSRGPIVSFNFSVAPFVTPSAGLTSYMTTTYVDSGNNIVAGPVSGGAVIYTFKDSSATAPGTTRTGTITVNIARTLTYLVVAGGGGGGSNTVYSGGGGAGGLLTGTSAVTASTSYTVTVGAGGSASTNGSNSVFSSFTATGGGAGATSTGTLTTGNSGGSGGGGSGRSGGGGTFSNGGTGTVGQGNNGGGGGSYPGPYGDAGGGGGGAGAVGNSQNNTPPNANDGGIGVTSTIQGLPATYYAGGGGGIRGNGGLGGGGGNNQGNPATTSTPSGAPGTNGLGGGGQAGSSGAGNGSGGSGVVILRFPI